MVGQRYFLLFAMLAAAAMGQKAVPAVGSETNVRAPIPNFTGIWTHPAFPWFEPPATGPGPITNLSRWPVQRPAGESGSVALPPAKVGISDYDQLVGDYNSPILQPWAAAMGQKAVPAVGSETNVRAPIPNFTGIWTHPAFPWFEPPATGPGPITNLSRWPVQRPSGES